MSRNPVVVRTVPALRRALDGLRGRKATVALVPTMGALHDGHVSLVRLARKRAAKVVVSIFLVPIYLTTTDPIWFLTSFLIFICFVGGKDALNPGWLSERFPTEVRATAAGFVYHQGAVWGAARS